MWVWQSGVGDVGGVGGAGGGGGRRRASRVFYGVMMS